MRRRLPGQSRARPARFDDLARPVAMACRCARGPVYLQGLKLGLPKEYFVAGLDPEIEK
jgi:hypothetical protein